MSNEMRGLSNFIYDIRHCASKEDEQKRVNDELAKVRKSFTSKQTLGGYDKKKYVWKLVYMYMLGYDVEIGHMEALKLISSSKYTEKQCGYLACSILLNENHELLRLVIQSMKKDLNSSNEVFQCLALTFAANVGGQEFAESLAQDVQRLLVSGQSRSFVRKKAALCLLRLFRKYPDIIPTDNFASKVMLMLDDHNIGVLTSLMSLLLGLVSNSTKQYGEAPGKVITLLTKLSFNDAKGRNFYRYYSTICPWLQVKLLRLLQYFPPPEESSAATKLDHVLNEILTKTVMGKNTNKNNADHAILFEAVNVIIHHCRQGRTEMSNQAVTLLGKFVAMRESNFRYLGLETMTKLATFPKVLPLIRQQHMAGVMYSLEDPDISIRKRALDLLYVMCDQSTAKEIVGELLKHLENTDYDLREELVIKIAILAERYAPEMKWYVDVVLQLVSKAGTFVQDDIWHRIVQIVTSNPDLQDYAASECFHYLKMPALHENGIKLVAYILGEFGHQITDKAITGDDIFAALQLKYRIASPATKALMLNAYVKMANTYSGALKDTIEKVFGAHLDYVDVEIQQRSVEYLALGQADEKVLDEVLAVMPDFPTRESNLLKRLHKKKKDTADRNVWNDVDEKTGEEESENVEEDGEEDDEEDDEQIEGAAPKSQSPKQQQPHQRTGDLLEMLGGGSSSTSTQQKTPQEAEDDEEEEEDDDDEEDEDEDEDDDDGEDPTNPGAPQQAKLVFDNLRKASGVIYASCAVKVAFQVQIDTSNGSVAKVILLHQAQQTISNVTLTLPQSDTVRIQARPEQPLALIEGGKQERHLLLMNCLKPFESPPPIKLSFTHSGNVGVSVVIRLPILMTHFCVPKALDAAKYKDAWLKFTSEQQSRLQLPTQVSLQGMRTVLDQGCRFALCNPDGDALSEKLYAAGAFMMNDKTSSPVLVRIETKANLSLIRVTVRSTDPTASKGVVKSIAHLTRAKLQE